MVEIYIGSGIIAIVFCIFQMVVLATAIDMGYPAIDRTGSDGSGSTIVIKDNPANASGKINKVEIWCDDNIPDCEVATFFVVSGNYLSTRDHEAIGTVVSGAKRTFTVDLDVEAGDYIGLYLGPGGNIDRSPSGGNIWRTFSSDDIPCENVEFSTGTIVISLYATGATVEVAKKKNVIFMGSNF